jgi:hypothetical protein
MTRTPGLQVLHAPHASLSSDAGWVGSLIVAGTLAASAQRHPLAGCTADSESGLGVSGVSAPGRRRRRQFNFNLALPQAASTASGSLSGRGSLRVSEPERAPGGMIAALRFQGSLAVAAGTRVGPGIRSNFRTVPSSAGRNFRVALVTAGRVRTRRVPQSRFIGRPATPWKWVATSAGRTAQICAAFSAKNSGNSKSADCRKKNGSRPYLRRDCAC